MDLISRRLTHKNRQTSAYVVKYGKILYMWRKLQMMIKCPECEKEISEEAVKCTNCGYILQKKQSIIGVIGFILSIIAIPLGVYVSMVLWTISLILCIIGCLEKNKKHGFSIAGNIISFVFLFMFLVLLL